MSTNEQKSATVPTRRVNLGGTASEKGEYTAASSDTSSPIVDKGATDKQRRVEQLAKAREAKKLKTVAKNDTEQVVAEPQQDVVDPVDNSAISDDDDDEPPKPVVNDTMLIPPRKRKAIMDAIRRGSNDEDEREEPPKKKHRATVEIPTTNSLRNMVLDKAIDMGRLAVASGVCSVVLVAIKAAAGAGMQPQPALNPDFFK